MRFKTLARVIKPALTALLLAFLSACNSASVVEDVNQSQANEIVAVLNEHGISALANKQSGGHGKYSVEVKRGYYSQAVSLLHQKGLPGDKQPSFNELVTQNGLIPNSREMDALKLDHALAKEIEEMLQNHPAVSSARVIVRLNFLKNSSEPAVSAVVQMRPGASVEASAIGDIIARVVPGVKKESVSVSLVQTAPDEQIMVDEGVSNIKGRVIRVPLTPFLFFWRVPDEDYTQIALILFGCIFVVSIVGLIIGYWYGYYQHSKQYFETSLPEVIAKPNRGKPNEVRSIDDNGAN